MRSLHGGRAAGCGYLLALALAGCGSAAVGAGDRVTGEAAKPSPPVTAIVPRAVGTGPGATRGGVRQVADPEEASSFPVRGTVHHSAASTPTRAGELVVAAGAPSDAEVRGELAQMKAIEQSERQSQQQQFTTVPGGRSIGGSGAIAIPAGVPEVVQKVIAGANEIADFPYVFGGGHASFVDNAYDCSGSVSYALAAGGLLSAPETSGELESWGAPGPGRYLTILASPGHVFMYVDGIMYNTAGRSGTYASRWQVGTADSTGFVVRHWPGL
jgi:cell wall-associated NlpC family hydrolase